MKNATGMCAETTTLHLSHRDDDDCPSMTSVPIDVATVVDHVLQSEILNLPFGKYGRRLFALGAVGQPRPTAPAARHARRDGDAAGGAIVRGEGRRPADSDRLKRLERACPLRGVCTPVGLTRPGIVERDGVGIADGPHATRTTSAPGIKI